MAPALVRGLRAARVCQAARSPASVAAAAAARPQRVTNSPLVTRCALPARTARPPAPACSLSRLATPELPPRDLRGRQRQQQRRRQQPPPQQQQPPPQRQPTATAAISVAVRLAAAAALPLLLAAGAAHAAPQPLAALAELDAAGAHALESGLRPLFAAFTLLYIIRIPMTWYPSIDGTKLPWLLAYAPTEPILRATRAVVPLVGGVDVTPIVWVGLLSFLNEILLGPQGILMLIQREGAAAL